jgi:hypothetical protein
MAWQQQGDGWYNPATGAYTYADPNAASSDQSAGESVAPSSSAATSPSAPPSRLSYDDFMRQGMFSQYGYAPSPEDPFSPAAAGQAYERYYFPSGPASALDAAEYQDILGRASGYFPIPHEEYGAGYGGYRTPSLDDVFNWQYSGRRQNINPYYSLQNRDMLRNAARQLGLSQADADRAALETLRATIGRTGQAYIEVDHPHNVADDIARRLFEQAGVQYGGLSPEQRETFNQQGIAYLEAAKNQDEGGGPFGSSGGFADIGNFGLHHLEQTWKAYEDDPERALLGINTPLESWAWGELLDKDYDPTVNMYGGPTKENYRTAEEKGIDTGGASVIQWTVESFISAYVGGRASGSAFGQTPMGAAAIQLGRAAFQALNSGDIGSLTDIIVQAALQQGINYSADQIAQVANNLMNQFGGADVQAVGQSAYGNVENFADVPGEAIKRTPGMLPGASLWDADMLDRSLIGPDAGAYVGSGSQFAPPSMWNADALDRSLIGPDAGALPGSGSQFAPSMWDADALDRSLIGPDAGALPGSGSQFAPASSVQAPDGEDQAPAEPEAAPEAAPAEQQAITGKDVQKYAKIAEQALKVYNAMNGGEVREPPTAPAEDATPEEQAVYQERLVAYLGLDPVAMAEAGLTPGTPEYLRYIQEQTDAIIAQVLEGVDVDAEDLSEQLSAKREDELENLLRALHLRGALGLSVGSGEYEDPFTSTRETVVVPEGKKVQPHVAAWQRGLARSAEELAGMRGQEAKKYAGGMLERDPDIFNLRARQDARRLQERIAQSEEFDSDGRKRRRGSEAEYWGDVLDAMTPEQLQSLLQSFGGDEERSRAALAQLLSEEAR